MLQVLPLGIPYKYGVISRNTLSQKCSFNARRFLLMIAWSMIGTVMKQSDLDSMSIDELLMLHERITATLAAKINAEKEALVDRLSQADISVH